MRQRGTSKSGGSFGPEVVQQVWEKGRPIPGEDSKVWMRDVCSAKIKRDQHGNTNSENGWEIDHKLPVAKGGSDSINNLQPLQWENNKAKSDGPLVCVQVS